MSCFIQQGQSSGIATVDCVSLISSGSKSIQSLNIWPIRLRVCDQSDGGYITHVSCNMAVGFPNSLKHHDLLVYRHSLLEVCHTTSKWFSCRRHQLSSDQQLKQMLLRRSK